ncbi:MAG: DUF4339 domain-containing protein [Muribaculaceae bacterium]|nr:DUF4339 domain-containing protein [Muribaculaceae bacterium]MBQ1798269.1 DUF4339 domain-containing protein [Muribaculaceae bacterium]MBQ4006236.1 DUF4339 domain-containing protein [Muribaculaceae bacterium]
MNYYLFACGQTQGPFTIEQLAARGLDPLTDVWAPGMPSWQPASSVPALRPLLNSETAAPATPPPLHTQQTPPPHPSTLAPQIAMAHAPVTTRRGGWILGTVAILAIIAGVLAWTNPTRAQHLNAINEVTAEWVGDKVDQHNPGNFLLGELFKLLGNTGTGFAIDHYLKVQSYGVCSIGRIEVGNKPHIVSVGVLGHVYTFDKQDIERTVDQLMRETINGHDDDYDS